MVALVTVYYTENCGSVLQAYALMKTIQKLGYQVVLISTKNSYSGHSLKRLIKNLLQTIVRKDFSDIFPIIKKYQQYHLWIKSLPQMTIKQAKHSAISAYVFGSDTIWDIRSKYFLASYDVFWGTAFPLEYKVAYGASVANSSKKEILSLGYPRKALTDFQRISVRDGHSEQVVQSLSQQRIERVCDPTFLLDKKEYRPFLKKVKEKNYMLVYLFDDLEQEQVRQILQFAKKNHLMLISVGKKMSWCERHKESTLENFLSYYYQADYIISNTFHGTIFSLLFHKQFFILDFQKKKVEELLISLNLRQRLVSDLKNLDVLAKEKIDNQQLETTFQKWKTESLSYLKKSLQS